jgi:sulfatase modifying factor 1
MRRLCSLLVSLALTTSAGCVVREHCYKNEDCPGGQLCNAKGECVSRSDSQVLPDGRTPIQCPLPNMVAVAGLFCADVYEASRPDATAGDPGTDESRAVSKKGVLPWQVANNAVAEQACEAAGKRLCTPAEWLVACQGPDKTVYAYGDPYDPLTCNGIDTFCECSAGSPCAGVSPCPYPHCYYNCGASFRLMPTGSFPDCTNEWGVFDINGNLWEHTAGGSDKTVRGGAYNCGDSETLHRCDYVPGWTPSARGFRCCADGVPVTVDAGPQPDQALDLPGPEVAVDAIIDAIDATIDAADAQPLD